MINVTFYHTRLTRWVMRKILTARLANLGGMIDALRAEHKRAMCGLSWASQSDRPEYYRTYFGNQISELNKEVGELQFKQALVQSQLREM
jgi:hypothetical protein